MIAGVPGVGINGLFYLVLAAGMPFRELPRVWRGNSSVGRWKMIAGLMALAAGVSVTLWGEYWLIEKGIETAAHSMPGHAAWKHAMAAASPAWSVAPVLLLLAVLGTVHLMRLILWLAQRGPRTVMQATPLLLVFLVSFAGSVKAAPPAVYQPEGFEFAEALPGIRLELDSFDAFYQLYFDAMAGTRANKAYGLALANQTLGLLRNDPAVIERAGALFALQAKQSPKSKESKLALAGVAYSGRLLNDDWPKPGPAAAVLPVEIKKLPGPQGHFKQIVLGRSAIVLKRGALVKTQVDRVTRDWALGRNPARVPWGFDMADHVPWHEGEKSRELVELAGARIVPVWGTHVVRINGHWWAPDEQGRPRFEVSPDKIEHYPTTLVENRESVFVNDTHGISAIAWDSLDADLVVGCGDHKGKMDAAFYLAERGVNVYVPTDRLIGQLVGADTRGTIIGSAPIRKTPDGAVIGSQPVSLDPDETIVVSSSQPRYPLQYYDAPKRYFEALSAYAGRPLKIVPVEVTTYGRADVVVDRARQLGAKVIGIRVKSLEEHDAVAAWLKEDRSRRAILFHSAVYPDGYRLYFEFAQQTSFGDTKPVFE